MFHKLDLLIYVETSPARGIRQLHRAIRIAEACQQNGGQVGFLTDALPVSLAQDIVDRGFHLFERRSSNQTKLGANEINELLFATQPKWLLIDADGFGDRDIRKLQLSQTRIAVMDEAARAAIPMASLTINPNGFANQTQTATQSTSTQFSSNGDSRFLTGVDFAIPGHPDPMRALSSPNQLRGQAKRVVVAFEGDHAESLTIRTVEALSELTQYELVVDVFVTPSRELANQLTQLKSNRNLNFRCHRQWARIQTIANRSDLAIGSRTTNCQDLASLGVPTLILSRQEGFALTAETLNQDSNLQELQTRKSEHPLSQLFRKVIRDRELRFEMAVAGLALNRRGQAQNFVRRMMAPAYEFRFASQLDSDYLFQLRNEAEHRAVAFQHHNIAEYEHQQWLQKLIEDENSILWLVNHKGSHTLGYICCDLNKASNGLPGESSNDTTTAILTLSLNSSDRGRGHGPALIEQAVRKLILEWNVDRVVVQFRQANHGLRNVFSKSGFQPIAPTILHGQTAFQMAFHKSQLQQAHSVQAAPLRKSA